MAHQISTNTRYIREEGNQQDLSIGAAIGLAGAGCCAAMAGCEVGRRAGKYACDKVARWWNDGKDTRGNSDNTDGGHGN